MATIKNIIAQWVMKQNWIPKMEFIGQIQASTISIMLNQALHTRRDLIAKEIEGVQKKITTKSVSIIFLFLMTIFGLYYFPIISVVSFVLCIYYSLSLVVDITNIYLLEKGKFTTQRIMIHVV